MTDTSYNGWPNYASWAMALWIDNDQPSYLYARAMARQCRGAEYPTVALADTLKDWREDDMPDLGASIWADLLGASFGEVDWYAIASTILSETEDA